MDYKLLGRSGLRVSELCLGTMTFGEEWGWGASREESRRIFDAFVDAGGNFFDTANFYTGGTSERMLGEFIGSRRNESVIATKYTLTNNPDDPNGGGNHRKNLHQSLEASLRRLGTDYVDLLWVHAWDFLTPVDEVMRALDDMVRSGKVLYVGISDTPAWIVAQANTLADWKGWSPFVGLQIQYSLIDRTPERELLPMAKALDLAVLAWGPLGGGTLTGKYRRQGQYPPGARLSEGPWGEAFLTDSNLAIAEAVSTVADAVNRSPAQVAISWLRQGRNRGTILPILGARKLSQVEDNLAALDLELSEGHRDHLDEISAIELGFPHDFLAMESVQKDIHGHQHLRIQNHRK